MESPLPDAALSSHIGILGKTGSGKTYTAKGLIERLLELRRQVVIIDPTGAWYGLRTGFEIPIFGGRHGDIEINDKAGEGVAHVIVEQRASAIVDLSLMSGGAQRRFMTRFAHRLRQKPPGALWLVIDEADEFLPQQLQPDMTNLFGDLKWMVRRGRLNGFRVMMITQRPAEIAKAVLTQIETLIAHRLTAPQDRKAVEEWVKGHHDPAEAREVLQSLASLDKGTAWLWAPDLDLLTRAAMPPIKTFDSSRTPDPGEDAVETPPLAALDLSAIRDALAAADEEATPAAAKASERRPAWPDQREEVQALRAANVALEDAMKRAGRLLVGLDATVQQIHAALTEIPIPAATARGRAPAHPPAGKAAKPAQPNLPPERRQAGSTVREAPSGGGASLSGPQLTMLKSLAWWAAMGHARPSRAQVATICQWRLTSGHIKNVASSLKSAGLVDYPSAGALALTDAGRRAAPEPDLALSFHDSLRAVLTGPQRLVFDYLLGEDGPRDRGAICAALRWEPTSGHIKNVVSSMKTIDLVDYPEPGVVDLQDWARNA